QHHARSCMWCLTPDAICPWGRPLANVLVGRSNTQQHLPNRDVREMTADRARDCIWRQTPHATAHQRQAGQQHARRCMWCLTADAIHVTLAGMLHCITQLTRVIVSPMNVLTTPSALTDFDRTTRVSAVAGRSGEFTVDLDAGWS